MYLFKSERLVFRELKKNDCDALHKILGNINTMQFYPKPYSFEEVKDWIKRNQISYLKYGFGLWAIELQNTGQFIGQCGITYQNIDNETLPEIGFHINKGFWNQGYATEAALEVIKFSKKRFNIKGLYINTYYKNIPTQKVAAKIGMSKIKEYNKFLIKDKIHWKHFVYKIDLTNN